MQLVPRGSTCESVHGPPLPTFLHFYLFIFFIYSALALSRFIFIGIVVVCFYFIVIVIRIHLYSGTYIMCIIFLKFYFIRSRVIRYSVRTTKYVSRVYASPRVYYNFNLPLHGFRARVGSDGHDIM